MAQYNQVSYGSKDKNTVTELQKMLNQNGDYNLAEDGIFGSNTLDAVKKYQQANGLAVDGIVGKNTWAALTKGQEASGEQQESGFQYTPYQQSDTVQAAYDMLTQHMQTKPGEYQSQWQTQLNDILQQILNREDFSYDLNGDALYQQYKDQYMQQGQMAMMDTMGQAQAMTGGYGNSYAQTAGQQAYQGYLQQLNDKVPELYQLALNQYNAEGDAMYNQASMLAGMDEQEYAKYRDSVSDYYTQLGLLTDDARWKEEQDYQQWADQTSFQYSQHRDDIADQQWQAEFDEAIRQYNQSYALSAASAYRSINPDKDPNPNPNPNPDPKPGFTGTTYSEAVAYLKSHGISGAANMMTKGEWSRRKASYNATGQGSDEVIYCNSYQEYLQYFVEYSMGENK